MSVRETRAAPGQCAMSRKDMREYAGKQMLKLRFDDNHRTVIAEDKRTGVRIWSGPIYELEARIRAGEIL
jgi:hypothetical protein